MNSRVFSFPQHFSTGCGNTKDLDGKIVVKREKTNKKAVFCGAYVDNPVGSVENALGKTHVENFAANEKC